MRVVIQRVADCSVSVDNRVISSIGPGLLVLLGMRQGDLGSSIDWLAEKIANLRIFEDENEKMNLSVLDTKGEIMLVSQFTLYGDSRKGRRPEFTKVMNPTEASRCYETFASALTKQGLSVKTGQFGAKMDVRLTNHGPVTIIIDHP
jgi:D-tyrosyl-tRNA(Tyr) deacylase